MKLLNNTVVPAQPGFESIELFSDSADYDLSPIVAWIVQFESEDVENFPVAVPVTVDGERTTRAIRTPDGRVIRTQFGCDFSDEGEYRARLLAEFQQRKQA